MANYNEHKCLACEQVFDYCRRCAITPVVYKAEGFCSEKCSEIFAILSKHSCNLITSEEAFLELAEFNIDEISLTEDIIAHIERINSDVGLFHTVEEEVIADEAQIVEQSNKKNKKKW